MAREWAASHGPDLNPDERAFLAAGRQREQRATRRRRIAVAALAVLTLVSAGTAGLAVYSNTQAVSARDQAITNQVVAEADQLQSTNQSLAAQLDLVAHRLDPTPDDTQLLATASTPLSNILTDPGAGGSVAFSPDGHTLAAAAGSTIRLWNITGDAPATQIGRPLTGPASGFDISSVAFSPDGHTLAAVAGEIWLWNITDPAHATQIGQPLTGPPFGVSSVAFSPDGHTLAAGGAAAHQPGPP